MCCDPLCPVEIHADDHMDPYWCDDECERIECQWQLIEQVRADERKWVTESAAKEIRNHKVQDGVCACGINAPDPLEHYAWLLESYISAELKPRHEVESQ